MIRQLLGAVALLAFMAGPAVAQVYENTTGRQLVVPCASGGTPPACGALPVTPGAAVVSTTTATAGSAHAVATGNTAVTVFAANSIKAGAFITNPSAASESLFCDIVNSPTAAAPGTNGTTTELVAGQSMTVPAGLTNATRCNAVTSAHSFTAVQY